MTHTKTKLILDVFVKKIKNQINYSTQLHGALDD